MLQRCDVKSHIDNKGRWRSRALLLTQMMEDYCKKIINLFGSSSVCRFILESTSTVWLQFYLKSCPPDMKLFWQVMCMGEGHTHIRAYTTTFLRWKTEREGERKRLWPATMWSKLFFVRCICQLWVEGWMSERKREKKKERERERGQYCPRKNVWRLKREKDSEFKWPACCCSHRRVWGKQERNTVLLACLGECTYSS